MSDRVPADPSYGELQALQSMLLDASESRREALRKRDAQHREEIELLVDAIVDVLDSMDRLLQRDETLAESWKLITRQFASALDGTGLDVIGDVGEVADPHTHRVIETRQTTKTADATVLTVLRRGYRYRGRVLRPADVIVAASPQASARSPAAACDSGTGQACSDQEQE